VVYLVRSSRTYARIRSLTTGTFNLVVKDRIAFRLSGAPSGLDGFFSAGEPTVRIRLSSKPYKHTVGAKPCQSAPPTVFPRLFHSGKGRLRGAAGELSPPKKQVPHRAFSLIRNDNALRGGGSFSAHISAQRYGLPLGIANPI
jgi:hypothetical protein